MSTKVKVDRVIDGDTFVGTTGGKDKFYRLAGVDTPEKGKDGFATAKAALQEKIGGKTVSVEQKAIGHYGRAVVDVKTSDGKNVNTAMKKHEK